MFTKRAAVAVGICLVGCQGTRVSAPVRDPHSSAQPERVAIRHLALDLAVDFEARRLTGTARLELARHDVRAPLVLDVDGLAIQGARACGGPALRHRLEPSPGGDGRALVVELASDCVELSYQTGPDASALLWVEPAGTAGGAAPMLFTQSQATHARSWIPLQDSPSIRFTYEATVRAPPGMWALMSADNPRSAPADGVWRFRQPRPIPSYLMALAVGAFSFRPTGPRSGVYAEPALVDAAAFEFAEVEAMMAVAEELYGPYRWSRYDLLVLPPSFPFGGMENPNLTFLTPTVLTGDRALVSLIAHELAHSWSGNLATNSTWNDVWLNEGMTTYVENRIMERLRGAETAEVQWHLSGQAIARVIDEAGPLSPRTRLAHRYGAGTRADDIPSDLAYEKGAVFLRTLELAYGRDRFDRFLRGWFDRHAFAAVDTPAFIAEARAELGSQVDLERWLYGTGLPADAASTRSGRATALETTAQDFARDGREPDARGWSTLDWSVFLRALPAALPLDRLAALDARYQLTGSPNAEIGMHWLPHVIASDARERAPEVKAYLARVGRSRNITPLYQAMLAGGEFWRACARDTFADVQARYHPITRARIARMLAPP